MLSGRAKRMSDLQGQLAELSSASRVSLDCDRKVNARSGAAALQIGTVG